MDSRHHRCRWRCVPCLQSSLSDKRGHHRRCHCLPYLFRLSDLVRKYKNAYSLDFLKLKILTCGLWRHYTSPAQIDSRLFGSNSSIEVIIRVGADTIRRRKEVWTVRYIRFIIGKIWAGWWWNYSQRKIAGRQHAPNIMYLQVPSFYLHPRYWEYYRRNWRQLSTKHRQRSERV